MLAAILPALVFAAVAAFSAYSARRMAAEFDLLQTAREISSAVDAEFGRRQALLQALANSPALRSGDFESFYSEAKAAGGEANVVLMDATTGRRIVDTSRPWGAPMPATPGDDAWIADVVRTRASEVKDVRLSPVRHVYDAPLQTPVIIDGQVRYVLHSGETAAELGRALHHFGLPKAWFVVMTDRRGVRAAHWPPSVGTVGAPVSEPLMPLIKAGKEGVKRYSNREGRPTIAAVARSPLSGYSTIVGVPAAAFSASFERAAAWMFLTGLSACALGLALAAWMARRISRPLRAAADAARSIGRGGHVEAGQSGIYETDVIARALAEASRELAARSAERDRKQAELSGLASELEAGVKARTQELEAASYALAESEARLRAIFNSTFQLTGLIAMDGRIVAVNQAALEAGSTTKEAVIGKPLWDTPWWAQTPSLREELPKAFQSVKSGAFLRTEVLVNLPAGARVYDFSMRPLYLHGGDQPDHVLVEGRDVTELKDAKERADRSQKMEALGLLTGGVAHDFNNILTVIKGAIEVALRAQCEPRAEKLLRAAFEASQRGEELNKQLLGFARKRPVTQESLEVADTVERMAPLLRNAVGGARRLELEVTHPEGACVVEAAQFETALLNLVVNARDATPEGGVVTVRVRLPTPEDRRRFPALKDDFVCVEVADTGHGISPENLGRVFDPFFTTKPPGRGTGLGLSQVYGFVHQSNGLIDVQSVVGQGTQVTMALPLEPAARFQVLSGVQRPAASVAPLKVLLVEDDFLVKDVSEAMLQSLGHQVTSASAASEALQKLEEGEFDLLMTDVIMPEGVNGVQLAREALRRKPGLKVLLCSGWTADALSEAEFAGAPWPLLYKPFSSEDLERAIAGATAFGAPRAG